MTGIQIRKTARGVALISALGLAGCADGGLDFGTLFNSNAEAGAAVSEPRPKPNAQGVIKYPTYAVIVANDGDTLESMAARVSVSAQELASLNGLPLTYKPRAQEVMVLPKDASLGAGEKWTSSIVTDALDRAPGSTALAPASANAQTATPAEPVRHKVEAGETAYSIARLYDVSVTSLASWNGLDAKLSVSPGRTLIIPVSAPARETSTVAEPGNTSVIAAPPSAAAPLPKNVDVAKIPESPELAKDRTPIGVQRKLALPVEGKIIKGFSLARGSAKNEGVDFETATGAVVSAAEAGEVALVSPSLDRDGKILLIRHADELITVYTDIDGITLKKGDKVRRGQKVGVVANADKPRLHFEVRRGVEPVDPQIYLEDG